MLGMDEQVTIRAATSDDVAVLPRMQVDAGGLFRAMGMAMVADGPEPEVAVFARAQQTGQLLVALVDGEVVGFVRLEVLDAGLHVEQVTVAPAHGGRGIGRRLMLAAEDLARERGYDRMTLTTFQDVPFNGPFYQSMGWQVLPADGLTPGLAAARQEEADAGLDAWPRQAMSRLV
jgi:GNAT superfamily N-acetyltransferase